MDEILIIRFRRTTLLISCILNICMFGGSHSRTFNIGFLSSTYPPFQTVEDVSPAIPMAIEDFKRTGSLQEHDFKIHWVDDLCIAKIGLHFTVKLKNAGTLDVVIGSLCSAVTTPVSWYTSVWNVPIFTQSSTAPSIDDKTVFNNVIRTNAGYGKLGSAVLDIFQHFGWKKAVLINSAEYPCEYGANAIYQKFGESGITLAEWIRADERPTDAQIDSYLDKIKLRSRVILMCFVLGGSKDFILRAHKLGLMTPEYTFIYYMTFPFAELLTPWTIELPSNATNTEIEERKEAFKYLKIISFARLVTDRGEKFRNAFPSRINEDPWTQIDRPLQQGVKGGVFSMFLYDAVYMYLILLNETLAEGGNYNDSSVYFNKARNRVFPDMMTGNVAMDEKADREPDFWFSFFNPGSPTMTEGLEVQLSNPQGERIVILNTIRWGTPGNAVPPETPICGFQDELCPEDRTVINGISIGASAFIFVVLVISSIIFYRYKQNAKEKELNQMMWRVNYKDIETTNKRAGSTMGLSAHTLRTGASAGSLGRHSHAEKQIFSEFGYYKGNMVAIKPIRDRTVFNLDRQDLMELKLLRELNHTNVNPFLGACIDPPNVCILSQYCSKGSLQDLLENEDISLEWMFKSSLITDLANAMSFLHDTPLQSHGNLKSSNCLVDSRWVLKISSFGLYAFRGSIKQQDMIEKCRRFLWTAPELLRMPEIPRNGTKKGDVYSFAIIIQEIIFRSSPFISDDISPDDIVENVRATKMPPFRPELPEMPADSEPKMVGLMKECWAEDPDDRPSFNKCLRIIKSMDKEKKGNIMDMMITRLEKYANNLEEIVEKRTTELVEEKKKTDVLLYRMLPPSIAEELKKGSTVRPEMFDAVTIFFSDIVGFTSLSSESTPIQVIDLLNDLYTLFDGIIDLHDVYKVETIGDAYMVVSGLPRRNGDRHAGEIANMALDLLSAVTTQFRIRHKPEKRLELRAGLHTGPCASGVVGLTMPRYCLFGDTVNMASRMESNGIALKIHLSAACHDALLVIGGFNLKLRGEMEIKGKGKQQTFWLEGRDGYDKPLPKLYD